MVGRIVPSITDIEMPTVGVASRIVLSVGCWVHCWGYVAVDDGVSERGRGKECVQTRRKGIDEAMAQEAKKGELAERHGTPALVGYGMREGGVIRMENEDRGGGWVWL